MRDEVECGEKKREREKKRAGKIEGVAGQNEGRRRQIYKEDLK